MTEPELFDRTPPHNHEAEQIVLGELMLSPYTVLDLTDALVSSDFYQPVHTTIFSAILTQAGRSAPTDPVAVATCLLEQGELQKVGGVAYLHTLVAAVPTAATVSWYARIVSEHAQRRRIIGAGARITQLAYNPQVESTLLADQATEALYEAVTERISTDAQSVGELLPNALTTIETAGQSTGRLGLATGLSELDELTHGMQDGQFWVLAGRPGMGKSVASLTLARSVALEQRKPTLIVSLEMSQQEVINRLLAAEGNVATEALTDGRLTEGQWKHLNNAAAQLTDAPLWIIDKPDMTLLDIRIRARRMARRFGLALLVVDYLQLLNTSGRRRESREREVAEISRGLKLLAKELSCPVVAAAQLNRGPEQRPDRIPQLGDLRESGALEGDCDVALLLHRPEYYDRSSSRPGEVDVIVAKNRSGRCGTVTAAAQLTYSRFKDMAGAGR